MSLSGIALLLGIPTRDNQEDMAMEQTRALSRLANHRGMKQCRECVQTKPSAEFYYFANGAPFQICKDCHKKRMKMLRLANRDVQQSDRDRARTPDERKRAARHPRG